MRGVGTILQEKISSKGPGTTSKGPNGSPVDFEGLKVGPLARLPSSSFEMCNGTPKEGLLPGGTRCFGYQQAFDKACAKVKFKMKNIPIVERR